VSGPASDFAGDRMKPLEVPCGSFRQSDHVRYCAAYRGRPDIPEHGRIDADDPSADNLLKAEVAASIQGGYVSRVGLNGAPIRSEIFSPLST
jgi:hypothetical protein